MTALSTDARVYLDRLAESVAGLPDADEIIGGVAEELRGLDDAAARDAIVRLGDPLAIAAAAHAASPTPALAPVPRRTPAPARTSLGWILAPALLMAIGGWMVPIVAPVVGLVLAWFSPAWTRGEKLAATLAPPACWVAIMAFSAITLAVTRVNEAAETGNPLIASPADFLWSGTVSAMLMSMVATSITGIVLLIIGLRRR